MSTPAAAGLQARFREEVLAGLALEQKAIPPHWFYDRRGSELFERITALPEYYPTRTERALIGTYCDEISRAVGTGRAVVEFGAGSAAKTPLLLDCIHPAAYAPIDISGDFLRASCRVLAERYPELPIIPIEGDFNHPVKLPREVLDRPRLGFFPGSTIGNLDPEGATALLRAMRSTLGEGSMLLIGMDLIKDRSILIPAYDDSAGVTAAFNLNLAERINRELGGTIPVDLLRHKIVWNEPLARIEMHLAAVRDLSFTVSGRVFSMREGETIHTESSHKYDAESADQLLRAGQWQPVSRFTDEHRLFMVVLARAA